MKLKVKLMLASKFQNSDKLIELLINEFETILNFKIPFVLSLKIKNILQKEIKSPYFIKKYLKSNSVSDKLDVYVSILGINIWLELLSKKPLLDEDLCDNTLYREIITALLNKFDPIYLTKKFSNLKLFRYIPFVLESSKDKILNEFNDFDEIIKVEILKYCTDNERELYLEKIEVEIYKVNIIKLFENDLLKIKYLDKLSSIIYKYYVIDSFKSIDLKKKYINYLDDVIDLKLKIIKQFNRKDIILFLNSNIIDENLFYDFCKENKFNEILLDKVIKGTDNLKKKFIKDIDDDTLILKVFSLIDDDKVKCEIINSKLFNIQFLCVLLDYINNDMYINFDIYLNEYQLSLIDIVYEKLKTNEAKKRLLLLIKDNNYDFVLNELKQLIIKINDNNIELASNCLLIFEELFNNNYINVGTNLELFNNKIFNILIKNKKLFILLCSYYDYAQLIIRIMDEKKELFNKLDTIINILYTNNSMIDDRLFIVLNQLYKFNNLNQITEKELKYLIFNILKIPEFKITDSNIINYEQDYNDYYDDKINKESDIEKLRELILLRYYKLSKEDALRLTQEFGTDLNLKYLNDEEIKILDSLKNIREILNVSDYFGMNTIVNNINVISIEESIIFYQNLKYIFIKNLKKNLFDIKKSTQKQINIYNMQLDVSEVSDDFCMLIHSTNAVNKLYVENNDYLNAWNNNSKQFEHNICCCHISNNNLLAFKKGVIFGFNSFPEENIIAMSCNDLGSKSKNNTTSVTNDIQFFCTNEELDKNTEIHNEVILERMLSINHEIKKIQPDYIVIFDKTTLEDLRNSLIASKQFNIPIVYIDADKIYKRNSKKVLDTLNNCNLKNNDINNLLEQWLDIIVKSDHEIEEKELIYIDNIRNNKELNKIRNRYI